MDEFQFKIREAEKLDNNYMKFLIFSKCSKL